MCPQENEYLKSIFDSISEEVMILDKNFNIIDVNKKFCIEYSISKEMAVGKKCYKITHKLNEICKLPECKCPVEDVIKTGKFSESIHCHEINGDETYFELLAYPIMTKDGKIKHIVKIGRDITERKKIQNQIKESEEELNLILSNVNDSVVVISKDLKILYMNKKAQEEFGGNHIGKVCYDILMNCNKVCDDCTFNKLITNYNSEIRFETFLINPLTSEKRFFEYGCTPILNFHGQPALIDIIRDITERKNAENILKDSEEKFRKLFENFPVPIILLNSNKEIYDCNSFTEIYLNKSKEDLIERKFLNLFTIPKKKKNFLDELISNVINFSVSEIIEIKFLNHNAKKTWVKLFFSLVSVGNKRFIQIVLQDITEKKLVENIIKEENKRLRELDQIKKQLMTQTSVELKSPLSSIFGASELLLDEYQDQMGKDALELVKMIERGGKSLEGLINNLLNISRIEVKELELNRKTESLIEIIEKSIEEIIINIKSKNIKLNLDLSKEIYSEVDKIRIGKAFKDILLNVIEITPKNGEILIKLQENKNFADILMQISNIGFNKQESLVDLHFSKGIIERHGGQINIASGRNEEGINFLIQLPKKNWRESLIHIYIIYKSGIPLYDYSFVEIKDNCDPCLISGGIIGILAILKAIIHGKKQIKTIDHGDRKIMFETNKTADIIFVLIVKEDLTIFRNKLNILIKEFDENYKKLIKNIHNTCNLTEYWESLQFLIEKHFEK